MMPSDYSGYDWYLKFLAWSTRIGVVTIIIAAVSLVVVAIRAFL